MKGVIIGFFIVSILYAIWQYTRTRDIRKLLVVLASFAFVLGLGVAGNLTRSIRPIYYLHMVLELFAWLGVLYYVLKDKYYWWVIASPMLTIALFVGLEYINGSRHESVKVG